MYLVQFDLGAIFIIARNRSREIIPAPVFCATIAISLLDRSDMLHSYHFKLLSKNELTETCTIKFVQWIIYKKLKSSPYLLKLQYLLQLKTLQTIVNSIYYYLLCFYLCDVKTVTYLCGNTLA